MEMSLSLKSAFFIGLAVSVLTGCSSNGVSDQAIGGNALFDSLRDKNRMSALATTAEYRTVVVNTEKNLACPEPSPDVGQAVSKIASMTANINPGEDTSEKLAASISALQGTLREIMPLLERTRGIQFYRDARSYNCFAHMNGALEGDALEKAESQALEVARLLLLAEIMTKDEAFSPESISADLEKMSEMIKDLQDISEAQAEK